MFTEDSHEDEYEDMMTCRDLLSSGHPINISAPMVRYSKHAFRKTVTRYGVHITYTPMILAQQFVRSLEAQQSDFTTSPHERHVFSLPDGRRVRSKLIVQFAANADDGDADLVRAVEMVRPYSDGVDLNCGCPQTWAYKEHIGSYLLRHPDRISSLVNSVNNIPGSTPISLKIRLDPDLKHTHTLMSTLLHLRGVSHITVHGRTRHQNSSEDVNFEGIKFCRELADGFGMPLIGNGSIWSLKDANDMRERCGVKGVMAARGLLENPTLFSPEGDGVTLLDCAVEDFVKNAVEGGLLFPLFHRHVAFMIKRRFKNKAEKTAFNDLTSYAGVLDYLEEAGM